ncbi:MAG: tRNA uridine-5-carboxymethylaminomethyl(34) synthesis GTPase MnmE [Gracilibacteraceae bacterium]|jgi:tRNA modification GTPase|nr:tRNA uridine-5-carboxymethylaminomethyl(34) synthesis GTPase MnmE [Gracilibacteraceae bacterium]
MNDEDQTIVALATPAGEGAIHIVRLSGKEAARIVAACFSPLHPERWEKKEGFTLHLGMFRDGDLEADQVLVGKMPAPASYTGEDVYEINCHGGMPVAQRVITACRRAGAVLAEPGEFTLRAFLHGKMDLVQAEAVNDLIRARTEMAAGLALAQLNGGISAEVRETRQKILDILAGIEAGIDFPEEETDPLARTELLQRLIIAKEHAQDLFAGSRAGRVIREGLATVIAGKPNVGKSSLLNALLREERAIVTDIPGTTRDEIHEYVVAGGILLHLIDTAGLRASDDPVEKLGIERTWKALNMADAVLLLLDARDARSGALAAEERAVLAEYAGKVIALVNKTDLLPPGLEEWAVPELAEPGVCVIPFSVKQRRGFEELAQELKERVWGGEISASGEPRLASLRQQSAVERTLLALEKAEEAMQASAPLDLISIDIRAALEEISQITGDAVEDDLLERIFTQFCIGK